MSKEMKQTIKEYVVVIVCTVVVTLAFLHFVQISRVVGESMENTYHDGNIVLVNKVFYGEEQADYNDVIIVKANIVGTDEEIIKRVIGLPGDTIVIKNNTVYRNGEKLDEPYIKEKMYYPDLIVTVKEHEVFFMGDNRNNSCDSRYLGCSNFDHVVGKVFITVWPFGK